MQIIKISKYLILIVVIFTLSCSDKTKNQQIKLEAQSINNANKIIYTLIKDNLYTDNEGNLYLRSKQREHFETGKWIDVWLKTVYCDSCWTPTKEGWKDITEHKDFVDTNSFHLDTTWKQQLGNFYEDKNYRYYHKYMADGGTISLWDKSVNDSIK